MATKDSSDSGKQNTTLIVLTLGLLIGFVAGFVLLLSSLPVDNGMAGMANFDVRETKLEGRKPGEDFAFFDVLAKPADEAPVAAPVVADKANVVETQHHEPATRVVPANAQIIRPGYQEVPAKYEGVQQSYYLQAGRFNRYEEARSMRAQVLLLGLDAFIVTREEADGMTAHRVRVGPYYDEHLLTEAKKRLRRGNINYEIVRVTG